MYFVTVTVKLLSFILMLSFYILVYAFCLPFYILVFERCSYEAMRFCSG